jgi:uncharacterized protein (TIGR02271 family)
MRLNDGRVIAVPANMIEPGADRTYRVPLGPDDIEFRRPANDYIQTEGVIPVLAEELVVEKKPVTTGGVRVNRRLLEHDETVELPLLKEHVDVRRVLIDREVEGPLPVRREGETTIIPIVEEVLIVEKRYRLKEEVHVTRTAREELHRETVTVRRQEAEVEQFDAEGRSRNIVTSEPQREPPPPEPERKQRRRPRRSILGDD